MRRGIRAEYRRNDANRSRAIHLNEINRPRVIRPNEKTFTRNPTKCHQPSARIIHPNDINHQRAIHPNETVGAVPMYPPERPAAAFPYQKSHIMHGE